MQNKQQKQNKRIKQQQQTNKKEEEQNPEQSKHQIATISGDVSERCMRNKDQ